QLAVHAIDVGSLHAIEQRGACHTKVGIRMVRCDAALVPEVEMNAIPRQLRRRELLVNTTWRVAARERDTRGPARRDGCLDASLHPGCAGTRHFFGSNDLYGCDVQFLHFPSPWDFTTRLRLATHT